MLESAVERLAPHAHVLASVFVAAARGALGGPLRASELASVSGIASNRLPELERALRECVPLGLVEGPGVYARWSVTMSRDTSMRFADMLTGINVYRSRVHRDANEVGVVISPPRAPSRLLEALQASFAGAEGLDETGQVLYDLAQSARRRLSVMTPFIDTDGAQRLVGLFRCSGGDVARELIVRSGRTQPLVAVADDLDSLGVRAYDYKLRHSGGWDESFHAKVVRVDDDQCYVGSSNMTESSFSHSLELGFRVSGVAGRRISRVVDAVIGVAQPLILRS